MSLKKPDTRLDMIFDDLVLIIEYIDLHGNTERILSYEDDYEPYRFHDGELYVRRLKLTSRTGDSLKVEDQHVTSAKCIQEGSIKVKRISLFSTT